MSLAPGAAGTGVVFRRSDLGNREIPAFYAKVAETRLGTVINDGNVSVGVIEHLMAAVAGLAIDDLIVTLDGPETPILDGDAQSYVALFDEAGLKETPGARRALSEIFRRRAIGSGGQARRRPIGQSRPFFCALRNSNAPIRRPRRASHASCGNFRATRRAGVKSAPRFARRINWKRQLSRSRAPSLLQATPPTPSIKARSS